MMLNFVLVTLCLCVISGCHSVEQKSSASQRDICNQICESDMYDVKVCGTDGILYKSMCEFDRAKCVATQSGVSLDIYSMGECITLNTTCDILNDPLVMCRGKDTEMLCASNNLTYYSICEFMMAKCRSSPHKPLRVLHTGACVYDVSSAMQLNCSQYIDDTTGLAFENGTVVGLTFHCQSHHEGICLLNGRTYFDSCRYCQLLYHQGIVSRVKMSVLVPSHGCTHKHKLRDVMGTSSYSDSKSDSDAMYISHRHRHSGKRKHKHRKRKKHSLQSSRSKLAELTSADKKVNAEDAGLSRTVQSKSDNYRTSGDYLNIGRDLLVPIEDMPDFSWLTKEFKFSDITNSFESENTVPDSNPGIASPEQGLSQREQTSTSLNDIYNPVKYKQDERAAIEQEIQEKYAEIDALIGKLSAKRHRSKRRRKYHLRKYDNMHSDESNQWIPSYVNICPIRRSKRCAQPIRDALLVRSAMRKAWKGLLGSCCGKGCWASWKWVSLRGVISDYE